MPPSQKATRQRCARSRPGTKVDFQFVNVKPDDPDQRSATRAVVRANAAHFHWRHNRPPRDKAKLKQAGHGHDKRAPKEDVKLLLPHLGADIDPFSSYNCKLPRGLVNHCIAFSRQPVPININPQLICQKMPKFFFPPSSPTAPTVSTPEQA